MVIFLANCSYCINSIWVYFELIKNDGLWKNLIQVPLSRQATDHTCGVASLQSILSYYGFEYRQDILSEKLHVEDRAKPEEIKRFAESLGFRVREHNLMSMEQLESFIDSGMPVLACMQA